MRILISGFEAFGGESVNPTAVLINRLHEVAAPGGCELRGVLLPVTFREAFQKLEAEIHAFDPDAVLAFGQAGGRDAIEFERVAINCMDADIPDNSGFQPRDARIDSAGAPAYFSTLPIRELMEAVQAAGLPARISNSAGLYVCNFLMYRLLDATLRTRRQAGFIHVPYSPEQAAKKSPPAPAMAVDSLVQALAIIVETLVRLRSSPRRP